jgi:hypothetical protein
MAERRYCKKCQTEMDFRLGQYECPDCGYTEVPQAEAPAAPQPRGLSSHKNLDPTAAFKLINPEKSQTAQLVDEHEPRFGPKARRAEQRADAMRDERIVSLVLGLLATGFNLYTLLFTNPGMDKIEMLTAQVDFLPDPQTFSNIIIAASVVGLIFFTAALFMRFPWLKWFAVLLVLGVMGITAYGMLTPGAPAAVCMSLQGWIAILVGLWLVIFFSRDIPNTASGDDAL